MGSICCLSRYCGDNFLKKTATVALASMAVLSAALSLFASVSCQYSGLVLFGVITLPFSWPVVFLIANGSSLVFVISCIGLYRLHCSRPSTASAPLAEAPRGEMPIQRQPKSPKTWEEQILYRLEVHYPRARIQKALKDIKDQEIEEFSKAREEGDLDKGVQLVEHFCSWDSKKK